MWEKQSSVSRLLPGLTPSLGPPASRLNLVWLGRRENRGSCMARDTIHYPAAARTRWETPKWRSTESEEPRWQHHQASGRTQERPPCCQHSPASGLCFPGLRTRTSSRPSDRSSPQLQSSGPAGFTVRQSGTSPAAKRPWPRALRPFPEPAARTLSGQSPRPSVHPSAGCRACCPAARPGLVLLPVTPGCGHRAAHGPPRAAPSARHCCIQRTM